MCARTTILPEITLQLKLVIPVHQAGRTKVRNRVTEIPEPWLRNLSGCTPTPHKAGFCKLRPSRAVQAPA
jgi:hypothetical protein